jgi:acetoacetyl-CoA synthetase
MESLTPIWTPSAERIATSRLTAFVDYIRTARAVRAPEYRQLHTWSVLQSPSFWTEVWNFTSVIGDRGLRASVDLDRMPGGRYFPDAMLNFTENVLRRRGEGPAILGSTESGRDVTLSHDELRDAVGRAANAFRASGIVAGDRIAAIAANTPETIVGALGAAAIGAVWSSC